VYLVLRGQTAIFATEKRLSQTMPYISPLKLLAEVKLPIEPKLDKDTLRIARQALLAEIDLSPNQTVKMGKSLLTKNDVIEYFDKLQKSEYLQLHEAIHADKHLLDFFTTGKIPVRGIAKNPIYQSPEFAEFIAPFYPEIFTTAFKEILNNNSFERRNALFALPNHWLDGAAKRPTEMRIKQLLNTKLHQLQAFVESHLGQKGVVFKKNAVLHFYDSQMLDTFNRLSESYTEFRSQYGVALLELAYIFWNNRNATESNIIARAAQSIKGNYDLHHQIQHYWSQCSPEKAQRERSEGPSAWSVIIGILMLIRIIVAIGNCERSSSSSSPGRVSLPTFETESQRYSDRDMGERVKEDIAESRRKLREAVPKLKEEMPETPVFYNPKKNRPEQLLSLLDSVARSNSNFMQQERLSNNRYMGLYNQIKGDTFILSELSAKPVK
jgi:hypothetical protein